MKNNVIIIEKVKLRQKKCAQTLLLYSSHKGMTWCNKDTRKVLQGQGRKKVLQKLNAATWFNKDVAKVFKGCNKSVIRV